jgi:hypothetical protein
MSAGLPPVPAPPVLVPPEEGFGGIPIPPPLLALQEAGVGGIGMGK